MKRGAFFSPVLLIVVIGLAAGGLILWFFQETRDANAIDLPGPSSHSRSALGYAGLAAILEAGGIPVTRAMNNEQRKTDGGLLVIAEPGNTVGWVEALQPMLRAPKILLVLPKWNRARSSTSRDWIEYAYDRGPYDAKLVLEKVLPDGTIARPDKVETWTTNTFRLTPRIEKPVQLVKSATMRPLIATADGILLGEIKTGARTVWVLSDPDVLANHALGKSGEGNAVLAFEIVKFLRGGTGKVVFEESLHGFGLVKPAAPPVAMFRFPFSIVTALCGMATLLLLWATMGRFGAPERAPVPLAAGKQGLVENVARLMDFAGHHRLMVHRYVEATINDAARQLHAPKGLAGAELAAWMARLGRVRGTQSDCVAILRRSHELIKSQRSDIPAFVAIARDIYRWKQEIIDGPSRHKRDH